MKVKDMIEKLQEFNQDKEIVIRFALDNEDDIGYYLKPFHIAELLGNSVAIYGAYTTTKEDCDFMGQVDLKEAYHKMLEE